MVFLMCTTESHKIPLTIASRCQQFTFRSVDFEELVKRMREICVLEGVEADDEALAVIAQAGEGSVRDSLSALDQAIAACGREIRGAEVRKLLGRFSLDALSRVTDALAQSDSSAMLEIVAELERTGQSLQHFCRELSRYFRNLLVAKVAGQATRLIGASPSERERLAAASATFSEEDLTRYLQLTLDLFKDLQYSLQPRLHMELGLVRLVQAGRLASIEQLIANLAGGVPPTSGAPTGGGSGAKPPSAPTPVRSAAPRVSAPPPAKVAPALVVAPSDGSLQQRLHAALMAMGAQYSADAVEHSSVEEAGSEVIFVTPRAYGLSMKSPEIGKALNELLGRSVKIKLTVGDPAATADIVKAAKPPGEAEARALADTEVKRFQELFPGSEVRQVRDLSDY